MKRRNVVAGKVWPPLNADMTNLASIIFPVLAACLLVLTGPSDGLNQCERKIARCHKMREVQEYSAVRSSDPVNILQQHDTNRLVTICNSMDAFKEAIYCLGNAFESTVCQNDLIYSRMGKYYDTERSIDGMTYFCQHYDDVMRADNCMSKNNVAMGRCVDAQVNTVAKRVQLGFIDQSMICRTTLTVRDCVRKHLYRPCGYDVVKVLATTMEKSLPRACDKFMIAEIFESSASRQYNMKGTFYIVMVMWILPYMTKQTM